MTRSGLFANNVKPTVRYTSALAYLLAIPLVNISFSHLPTIGTGLGQVPAATFIAGAVFILRDFAQRELGHGVIVLMFAGLGLSALGTPQQILFASGAAFAAGAFMDWAVYTGLSRSFKFSDRVLLSSLLAAPIDTLVFLPLIGQLSVGAAILMSATKISVALAYKLWTILNA